MHHVTPRSDPFARTPPHEHFDRTLTLPSYYVVLLVNPRSNLGGYLGTVVVIVHSLGTCFHFHVPLLLLSLKRPPRQGSSTHSNSSSSTQQTLDDIRRAYGKATRWLAGSASRLGKARGSQHAYACLLAMILSTSYQIRKNEFLDASEVPKLEPAQPARLVRYV